MKLGLIHCSPLHCTALTAVPWWALGSLFWFLSIGLLSDTTGHDWRKSSLTAISQWLWSMSGISSGFTLPFLSFLRSLERLIEFPILVWVIPWCNDIVMKWQAFYQQLQSFTKYLFVSLRTLDHCVYIIYYMHKRYLDRVLLFFDCMQGEVFKNILIQWGGYWTITKTSNSKLRDLARRIFEDFDSPQSSHYF